MTILLRPLLLGALLLGSNAATAALVTFNFSGTGDFGSVMNGSFSFDDSKTGTLGLADLAGFSVTATGNSNVTLGLGDLLGFTGSLVEDGFTSEISWQAPSWSNFGAFSMGYDTREEVFTLSPEGYAGSVPAPSTPGSLALGGLMLAFFRRRQPKGHI